MNQRRNVVSMSVALALLFGMLVGSHTPSVSAADPVRLGIVYNASIANSSANAFASDVTLSRPLTNSSTYTSRTSSVLRIAVCLQAAATDRACYLQIVRRSDSHREVVQLGSAALTNGVGSTFVWEADPAYAYNLRFAGSTTIAWASIVECQNDGF